ncbi:MAG: ABC transporter permease [Thermoguttaceae bacterium]|nr:ABC transporter permease [Thermoguttaceae bacterium]
MRILIRVYALLIKELCQLLTNPKVRMSLFIPPLLQLIFLGYAATMDLKYVDCAILDYSHSPASRELISCFTGSPTFHVHEPLVNEADMRERINTRALQLAVVIPANYQQAEMGHAKATVQIIVDGRSANSAGMALAYATNVVNNHWLEKAAKRNRIRIETRAWYNPNFNMQFFMVPSLLALIALIDIMLVSALSIVSEREAGTFDQLRMTPYSSLELLIAKGFSTLIAGGCQLAVGLAAAMLWFQVPFNSSYALLTALLLSFLGSSIGIGLLISTLTENQRQSIIVMYLVAVPFAMLSGMGTPLESMPDVFQQAMIINPMRHGIAALTRIFLEGATFWELRHSFYLLWGIAVGSFTLAYFFFVHRRNDG